MIYLEYFEYFLYFVIIISFICHYIMCDIRSFYCYNLFHIVFGFLSLNSIYELIGKTTIYNLAEFILFDDTGLWICALGFAYTYVLCIYLIFYNLYFIYRETSEMKKYKNA